MNDAGCRRRCIPSLIQSEKDMATTPASPGQTPPPGDRRLVRVWDLFVRLFHWSLVVTFFVAYFTEDDLLTLHVWAGYAAGALVLARIVWGFIGPRHARFSDFLFGPITAWRYVVDLLAFRARRYLGHSPAGGLMVLALLAGLLATVWSGLEFYAVEENAGPLAAVSAETVIGRAPVDENGNDDDDEDEGDHENGREGGDEEFWEDIHEALANLTFLLVLLHIGGVILASIAHRENLPRAMITGDKRAE